MKSPSDWIFLSSSELGISIGISQQTASRYLLDLERKNLISRKISGGGQRIQLSSEGYDMLYEIYTDLKKFFEGNGGIKNPVFEGEVISGIGEGAYYVKKYEDRIKKILEFRPFLGTLNIKLREHQNLERYSKGIIKGFKRDGRTFGDVKFLPVKITFNEKSADCYLILPKRTHHRNIVEIISESNLREKLGIRNGDGVKIELRNATQRNPSRN